jgi:phospholipid/cholesterol/gamma-HCH transport system substrate-binding protein
VTASNRTLGAFAAENRNLSAAVRELAPTLTTTSNTLRKVRPFARELGPTLDSLRPAFRQLDDTNAELRPMARQGTPILRRQIRPFVRRARPYVRELRPAATDLSRSSADLQKSLLEGNRFFNISAYNKDGAEPPSIEREESYLHWLAWTANNGVSLFSTSDASGPFRRAAFFFSCSSLASFADREGELAQVLHGLRVPGEAGSFAQISCPEGQR